MSMIDQWLNTPIKRFKMAVTLYLIQLLIFVYGQFVVFYAMISIQSSQDLLTLTQPRLRVLYWPLDLIATVMDRTFSLLSFLDSLWHVLPFGFFVVSVLIVYIASFDFKQDAKNHKHQLHMMLITTITVVQVFLVNFLFLYGFFAGTVASAINRVNISGVIGASSSVVLGLTFIIIGSLLWIDLPDQNE